MQRDEDRGKRLKTDSEIWKAFEVEMAYDDQGDMKVIWKEVLCGKEARKRGVKL